MEFNTTQTLPATNVATGQHDEGMNLYLQSLGVFNIDEEYNRRVREFELQLEEAELAAKLQATTAAESQANIAVEAQPGLGTGAAAVASEGRQKALQNQYETIESSILETYREGIQSMSEEYQSELESVLGKYDATTGTFAGLSNYESMSNQVTTAMAKVIAKMIDPSADTVGGKSYTDVLRAAGYILEASPNGEITMTEKGQQMIDALVNGVNVNEPQATLGGYTLQYALAEQMAKDAYASEYISEDGLNRWELLSDSKRAEIITEYESWIYNNQMSLRLTAWDLYDKTDTGYILDTTAETPSVDTAGIVDDSGIRALQLSIDDVSDCTQEEFDIIKKDLISGKITDGSFFTFQSGKAYAGDKFYYIKNGTVYETNYTVDNPPPVIREDQATVYSFGRYKDTGEGIDEQQDKWVSGIIYAAKAGRIPDGTYIDFNFGAQARNNSIYLYEDGKFIKVNTSAGGYIDTPSGRMHYKSDAVISNYGGNDFSAAARNILGLEKTFLGWGDSLKNIDW